MKVCALKPIIDLSFWQKTYYLKLDEQKLSEQEQLIHAYAKYSKFNDNSIRINIDESSFKKSENITFNSFYEIKVPGILKIVNKKEFLNISDQDLLKSLVQYQEGNQQNVFFYLLLYIDHKKFIISYNFYEISQVEKFNSLLSAIDDVKEQEIDIDLNDIKNSNGLVLNCQDQIFCDSTIGQNISKMILNEILTNHQDQKHFYLNKTPLLLKENQKTYKISVMKFTLSENFIDKKKLTCKKIFDKTEVNLKQFLNRETIIENQSQLNLKLMKWRLEPNLDLENIASQKVFILGTGTLGCNLARLLVAYGVKNITFLDNGYVSFSNLARQSLFNTDNFNKEEQGLPKVEAAKINLLKIAPFTEIQTLHMKVPMPGHFIVENQIENTMKDLEELEKQIQQHDILLNCFDSREARYFPTLLGGLYRKKVFSIGIGYDSYVIVNHGIYGENFKERLDENLKNEKVLFEEFEEIKENKIGCFFCSDYIPPSDTITNRTMDQQCTVSRPGVSMIACGQAIEIIINSLHNDKLGKTPTFSRGMVGSNFDFQQYDNSRYENCTACCPGVISEYLKNKKDFLLRILNNPEILNKFSGFNDAMNEVNIDDLDAVIMMDDLLVQQIIN